MQEWLRMAREHWRLPTPPSAPTKIVLLEFLLLLLRLLSVQKHIIMSNDGASISSNDDFGFATQVENFPKAHQSPESACPI